ncbi:RHTO0S14e04676g1_1 [Rhodotorula toruloides]|uniref:RHTO0S14e04676g1_1 n=1 Tax=Rhodotorula toruloides TaxID=5286 RepID=A0A061BDQ3_RHOTO|nr:RHTO0S14e04676g1_1 [Rhodotorula toruloides]
MSTPFGAQVPSPTTTKLFNGPDKDKLDRLAIREICEGWPCHRDARNWRAYRSMFTDDAQVFTTWSAGKSIDDFISASIAGFNRGERIMHAAMGCSVELGANSKRAVGILKTCIDQRFELEGEKGGKVEVDAQCLNRFCFFCEKNEEGEWKVAYYKVIYEKDRLIPVDPRKLPKVRSPAPSLVTHPRLHARSSPHRSTTPSSLASPTATATSATASRSSATTSCSTSLSRRDRSTRSSTKR